MPRTLLAAPAGAEMRHFHQAMASEGIATKLKVLSVPDSASREQRVVVSAQLYRQLSQLLPGYEVELAFAEGPLEDEDGNSSHFRSDAL